MGGGEEGGDAVIETVDGEGVPGEVVGTDGEEVDFAGEHVGHEGGTGDFDHHADLHGFVEGDLGFAEFLATTFEDGVGLTEFGEAGDHGVHEADPAVGGGAEDGSELGLEDIWKGEADPDGAPAEEGVLFAGPGPGGG